MELLFGRGLDQTEQVREELLAECADDLEIQQHLRELWMQEECADTGMLDRPPEFAQLLHPMPLLSVNERLAKRFTVLEMIGSGGMGEVYRARDERLQRIVAVKVLSARLSSDAHYRKRLEQEARAVSSLSHPGICSLHDLCADGELLFLVMEHVQGEPLDVRLRRGPLSEKEAIEIAVAICEGLQHAHGGGLVHRDLKPANVMLGPHGVKLLDFGIACRMAASFQNSDAPADGRTESPQTGLTGLGQIIGTPRYMSPEQAAGRPVDARSDIYSVGLLIREMIDPAELSNRLKGVVQRCLEPDPERRFASASELGKALGHAKRRPFASPAARRWAASATVILGVSMFALWYTGTAESQTGEPRLQVLTAYPGTEYAPTLSPDGTRVAFLWNGESNNYDIYVRPVDRDAPLRLTTHSAQEHSPRWSPDGRWIAFERNRELFLIAPSGGPERMLSALEHGIHLNCDSRLSWSADSKRIFYSWSPSPGKPAAIHDIDIVNGSVRMLTHPTPDSTGHWCPVASPDGRYLLYRSDFAGAANHMLASLGETGGVSSERQLSWWMVGPIRGRLIAAKRYSAGSHRGPRCCSVPRWADPMNPNGCRSVRMACIHGCPLPATAWST